MPKFSGFLQLRRGIFEHLRDGRLTHMEALALIYILTQADTRTGVWSGSAGALAGELGLRPRTARDLLERLSGGGYLKRFPVAGRHSCYPILIHKYQISTGEHNGEQLNAIASASKSDLRFFPREHDGEQHDEHGASQKKLDTGNRRQKPRAQTARATRPDQDEEYSRKQEARRRRLADEEEVRRELQVGAGPVVVRKMPSRSDSCADCETVMETLREIAGTKTMK